MIRATTIGVLKNYRSGLNKSFTKLNDARTTVLTHRNFNSYAEDPSAAALSFQLRRSRMTVESQYTVCDSAYRKFQSAWSALETVVNDVDNATKNTIKEAANRALNDPTGDARAALGKELNELADTLVQVMNNKYGDSFIFSGADGQTVPFSWGTDGALLYRGIPVDAAVPELQMAKDPTGADTTTPAELKLNSLGQYDPAGGTDHYLVSGKTALAAVDLADPTNIPANALRDTAGNAVLFDANGHVDPTGGFYMTIEDGGTISKTDYETVQRDVEKLDYLSNDERYFLDIGLGNEEDSNDNLIKASAFDATLQGINFLGYGKDADGDPKNIVSLVKQMAGICTSGNGILTQSEYDELFRLVGKTEDASARLQDMHTAMDASTSKLKNNCDLLVQNYDNLREQYSEIEDVDDADAISAFIWAQYSYNAALRVGNSVLAQSLMDYMQ